MLLERLAHPDRDAFTADRDRAGDGLLLLLGCKGQEVADPDLVGEHGSGSEHFNAVQDNAGVVRAGYLQAGAARARAVIELGIARALRATTT